jgi:hypothetical protein
MKSPYKSFEFDIHPEKTGVVKIISTKNGDELVIESEETTDTLLTFQIDLWGTWIHTAGGYCIAQEYETRSFLDALIKTLTHARDHLEYECEPATECN